MLEAIEVSQVKRFAENTAGRDFAVGDTHGHVTGLQAALDAADLSAKGDRVLFPFQPKEKNSVPLIDRIQIVETIKLFVFIV